MTMNVIWRMGRCINRNNLMNERKPSLAQDYEAELDEAELSHDIKEFEFLMELLSEENNN